MGVDTPVSVIRSDWSRKVSEVKMYKMVDSESDLIFFSLIWNFVYMTKTQQGFRIVFLNMKLPILLKFDWDSADPVDIWLNIRYRWISGVFPDDWHRGVLIRVSKRSITTCVNGVCPLWCGVEVIVLFFENWKVSTFLRTAFGGYQGEGGLFELSYVHYDRV